MLKTLIWIVSNDGRFFNGALNILERQHNGIDLVAVTAGAPIGIVKDGKQIPFVPLNKIDAVWGGGYDVLLVVGAKQIGMSEIVKAARQLQLPEEKLLGDWIVCIPGFTLDKYRRLQRSRLSILSRQCFGGFISNTLGLLFRSPFVNLWVSEEDFIKFLRAPKIYLEAEPHFEEMTSAFQNYSYPLFSLGDISLYMMHYKTAEESILKWNERKTRINWYNLIAITRTKDEKILQEFDTLPYGKKICVVSFKSDSDSAYYINPKIDKGATDFENASNRFAAGHVFYYDVFDMLLYGKKTPLIEM